MLFLSFMNFCSQLKFQQLHCYSIDSLFADFDNEIESGKSKLSDILDREDSTEEQNSSTNNFSFGSFSSTITKKRADGVNGLAFMIYNNLYLSSITFKWLFDRHIVNHIAQFFTFCLNSLFRILALFSDLLTL